MHQLAESDRAREEEITSLQEGAAFVGEEYAPGETVVGHYWWGAPGGRHLHLHTVQHGFPAPAQRGVCYRYTGPITAPMPQETTPPPKTH